MKITLGCDPELFAVDRYGNFLSVHDCLPGTKEEPFKVKRGSVQVDGVSAEFNIDPVDNLKDWETNINQVIYQMMVMLRKNMAFFDHLKAVPVADFDPKYFDSLPETPKYLGCSPDYNAYTGMENEPPNAQGVFFRTGSGHIHVGFGNGFDPYDPEHFELCCRITKQLDAVLYPISFLWDTDTRRRELYGNVGAFRPKPYGMEYRVLSNAWLRDPKTVKWVFNATMQAASLLLKDGIQIYDGVDLSAATKDPRGYNQMLNRVYKVPLLG